MPSVAIQLAVLSVAIQNVVRLNVSMLNVVAPFDQRPKKASNF